MSGEHGLKIAVSGKGGVGKTTFAALLARHHARAGKRVIAVDADPVANLAAALGIPEDPPITPIVELRELIAERTGTAAGQYGGLFTLNPKVDDLPDRFSREREGVRLLVAGTVNEGGSGCFCPESAVLRALMQHLILYRDDALVMDMEAGVEHIGRATTRAVDRLVVVVDPGARSQAAAKKIRSLAADIGLTKVSIVINRVRDAADEEAARKALQGFDILGAIPWDDRIAQADRAGIRPFDDLADAPVAYAEIASKLITAAP